jgi:hypothetical protein
MRHLIVAVTLLASSFALHGLLFFLGLRRIDPIIYVAPRSVQLGTYPHAELILSHSGLLTWVGVAALFSFAVVALLKRVFIRSGWYGLLVFAITLPYLAVVHPHFLWVTLSSGARSTLESVLRNTPLYSYYFGNGFFRFRIVLPFLYALLVYVTLAVGRRRPTTIPDLASARPMRH